MRTLAPLYIPTGDTVEWSQALRTLEPGDIGVVNPASGPGGWTDGGWVHRIAQLHDEDVLVAGYVATGYSAKDWRSCVDEAAQYRTLGYEVDLIFWDEICGLEPGPVLRGLHGFSRSLMPRGTGYSVFNLGTAHSDYTAQVAKVLSGSIWVTFESPGAEYPIADRSHQAHLVYAAEPALAATLRIEAMSEGLGWFYATADTMPNPWDSFEG